MNKPYFKVLGLIAFFTPLFFLTSCSDDNDKDEAPNSDELILGMWVLSNAEIDYSLGGQPINPDDFGLPTAEGFSGSTFDFKADGSVIIVSDDGEGNSEETSGTWSINKEGETEKLTLTGFFQEGDLPDDPDSPLPDNFVENLQTYDIVTITNDNLDLANEVITELDPGDLPIPVAVELKIQLNLNFTRP